VFYTPAQFELKKVADEDPARASTLSQWFHSSANSSLVRSGEEGLKNQSAILSELRGREINPQTIQQAIGRLAYNKGIHYATDRTPRPTDPRQHADSGSFMPKDQVNVSAREAAARRASAAAGKPTSEPAGTDYRALADGVKGSTHSKTEAISRLFVMTPGTSQIDYEKTYFARRRAAGL